MTKTHLNFINGRWTEPQNGRWLERENPANGEPACRFPDTGADEVAAAVKGADEAYDSWRFTPAPRRAEILFRAAELFATHKEELSRDVTIEMGKVLAEARGDVQEAVDMAYYVAGEGRRMWGQTSPSELPDKFCFTVRQPHGVVAAITPWNFPIAIPAWKIMPALVTGNTVVWKPSPFSPLSPANFVRILEEAGLPPGVVNLVYGGDEAGAALVEDPRVAMVSFTGSLEVGREIGAHCGRFGKRLHLELGGKNAIIVMDDADIDLAVDGAVWSAFGTSGQRCTAASRMIVHERAAPAFTEQLVTRAQALRLGDGLDPRTDVGPVVNRPALDKIGHYMDIGRDEGAAIACGGSRATGDGLNGGYFFEPTVFADVRPEMRVAQEEIFGPVTDIIKCGSLEEAIGISNGVQYGLVSAIFTNDMSKAMRAMERLSTGMVYLNAGTIGAEVHFPFGGTRGTGNGHREAGQAALDSYSEWKTVYMDYSGRLQKAQIDTHGSDS
ncbi:MAG TPA: aldehyde dehydrogenase family protein [Dehalococcoidia bacterium]|nr:aldehyde dehydrogenase family protein [Dehalococcoidia bacterium]